MGWEASGVIATTHRTENGGWGFSHAEKVITKNQVQRSINTFWIKALRCAAPHTAVTDGPLPLSSSCWW